MKIFYEDLRGKLSKEFTAQLNKGGDGGREIMRKLII
jgi:hypothetical protein